MAAEMVQWAGVTRAFSLRALATALLSGVLLFGGSCLNPRPEELPSGGNTRNPGQTEPLVPGFVDPGIGGDDLPPQSDDDGADQPNGTGNEGQQPGTMVPVNDMGSAPPGDTPADAGFGPDEGIPAPDAGVDGG